MENCICLHFRGLHEFIDIIPLSTDNIKLKRDLVNTEIKKQSVLMIEY